MKEQTCSSLKKTLRFEKTGEAFSICINIENVSPETKKETVISFLDTIFEKIKEEIKI